MCELGTFSQMLCVSKELQKSLMHAAKGSVIVSLRSMKTDPSASSKLAWVKKHYSSGTLRSLTVTLACQHLNDTMARMLVKGDCSCQACW